MSRQFTDAATELRRLMKESALLRDALQRIADGCRTNANFRGGWMSRQMAAQIAAGVLKELPS